MWIAPHCFPAQCVPTRTQHVEAPSFFPSRSHGNCTRTRPYLSVKISSPEGPTTSAVWHPCTTAGGVVRSGRNGCAAGMHVNALEYGSNFSPAPATVANSERAEIRCRTDVRT